MTTTTAYRRIGSKISLGLALAIAAGSFSPVAQAAPGEINIIESFVLKDKNGKEVKDTKHLDATSEKFTAHFQLDFSGNISPGDAMYLSFDNETIEPKWDKTAGAIKDGDTGYTIATWEVVQLEDKKGRVFNAIKVEIHQDYNKLNDPTGWLEVDFSPSVETITEWYIEGNPEPQKPDLEKKQLYYENLEVDGGGVITKREKHDMPVSYTDKWQARMISQEKEKEIEAPILEVPDLPESNNPGGKCLVTSWVEEEETVIPNINESIKDNKMDTSGYGGGFRLDGEIIKTPNLKFSITPQLDNSKQTDKKRDVTVDLKISDNMDFYSSLNLDKLAENAKKSVKLYDYSPYVVKKRFGKSDASQGEACEHARDLFIENEIKNPNPNYNGEVVAEKTDDKTIRMTFKGVPALSRLDAEVNFYGSHGAGKSIYDLIYAGQEQSFVDFDSNWTVFSQYLVNTQKNRKEHIQAHEAFVEEMKKLSSISEEDLEKTRKRISKRLEGRLQREFNRGEQSSPHTIDALSTVLSQLENINKKDLSDAISLDLGQRSLSARIFEEYRKFLREEITLREFLEQDKMNPQRYKTYEEMHSAYSQIYENLFNNPENDDEKSYINWANENKDALVKQAKELIREIKEGAHEDTVYTLEALEKFYPEKINSLKNLNPDIGNAPQALSMINLVVPMIGIDTQLKGASMETALVALGLERTAASEIKQETAANAIELMAETRTKGNDFYKAYGDISHTMSNPEVIYGSQYLDFLNSYAVPENADFANEDHNYNATYSQYGPFSNYLVGKMLGSKHSYEESVESMRKKEETLIGNLSYLKEDIREELVKNSPGDSKDYKGLSNHRLHQEAYPIRESYHTPSREATEEEKMLHRASNLKFSENQEKHAIEYDAARKALKIAQDDEAVIRALKESLKGSEIGSPALAWGKILEGQEYRVSAQINNPGGKNSSFQDLSRSLAIDGNRQQKEHKPGAIRGSFEDRTPDNQKAQGSVSAFIDGKLGTIRYSKNKPTSANVSLNIANNSSQRMINPIIVHPDGKETKLEGVTIDPGDSYTTDIFDLALDFGEDNSFAHNYTVKAEDFEDMTTSVSGSYNPIPLSAINDPFSKSIIVDQYAPSPSAKQGIRNVGSLPKETEFSWKDGTPSTDKPGTSNKVVIVHYPDGSSEEVETTITVNKTPAMNEAYNPSGKDITLDYGADSPEARQGVDNPEGLPQGTSFSWKEASPITDKPGKITYTITVTYPDKTQDEVESTVTVRPAPEMNTVYDPQGRNLVAKKGSTPPDAKQGISNVGDLPDGSSFAWKDGDPSTDETGTSTHTVVVTYPDDTKDEAEVELEVKDNPTMAEVNTPNGTTIKVNQGDPSPRAKQGIDNPDGLPEGTTFAWKDGDPGTDNIGSYKHIVTVSYPDGSSEEVEAEVIVSGKPVPVPEDKPGYKPTPAPKETPTTEETPATEDKPAPSTPSPTSRVATPSDIRHNAPSATPVPSSKALSTGNPSTGGNNQKNTAGNKGAAQIGPKVNTGGESSTSFLNKLKSVFGF